MKTVVEMAREAGLHSAVLLYIYGKESALCDSEIEELRRLEHFAALVRADEREACAKVAEDSDHVVGGRGYYDQLGDADATVRNIVAAIRARGETK